MLSETSGSQMKRQRRNTKEAEMADLLITMWRLAGSEGAFFSEQRETDELKKERGNRTDRKSRPEVSIMETNRVK